MTDKLTPLLTDIIASPRQRSYPLERGLTLAYTPGILNNGRYRLTLSRIGKFPSQQELDIIKGCLRAAIKARGKMLADNMIVEPFLKRGKYWYHVIEWRETEAVQGALL